MGSMTDETSAVPSFNTAEIVRSYDSFIVRLYCTIRFIILHERFVREIGQYLPTEGKVLDIGCGFGLFAITFAKDRPGLHIRGFDLNARRIETARRAAASLGVSNVEFEVGDATRAPIENEFNAVYLLDIIHHIPPESVRPLLMAVCEHLAGPGSRLIIKDIDVRPAYKRWFTWWLDKAMDFRTPVSYWPRAKLTALLEDIGFTVYSHNMVDYLPYPHIIYICERQ